MIPAGAKSWVEVDPDSDFPIQNLPFAVLKRGDREFLAVAIGHFALDLSSLWAQEFFETPAAPDVWSADLKTLRAEAYRLLREDTPDLRDDRSTREAVLVPLATCEARMFGKVEAFVDFYSGIHHAENVGRMFRPEQAPLLPNYRWLPVAYNGRADTVSVEREVRRPLGQLPGDTPSFGPCKALDFELEMGFLTKPGPVEDWTQSLIGLTLCNDWSARDVQRWEYQPLGPFLSKGFATRVSPWVVTLDALAPFRIEGMTQEPTPLEHLRRPDLSHFDIELEVTLKTQKMSTPQTVARSNTKHLYWSAAQQMAHLATIGPLAERLLFASGTISGPEPHERGSMLELAWKGDTPIQLEETGETRTYLQDGDEVTFRAWAQGDGYRIGFGDLTGQVMPAR